MNGLTQTFALAGTIGFCPPDDVSDHLGSIRSVIIDGDTAVIFKASDYYSFGKRIPSPAAESTSVFGSVPVTESTSVFGPVSVTEPVEVAGTLEVTVASTFASI